MSTPTASVRLHGRFAHRLRRRYQAVLESDTVFKTAVIGSGFLSAFLAMMALLSAA